MHPPMRRKSREMNNEKTYAVLKNSEYGILCTADSEMQPYGTPLNYIVHENTIYFHCATKGAKVNTMRQNAKVCFTVVGNTQPCFDGNSFSTFYESVMVFGKAFEVSEEDKKSEVLTALCMKYLPQHQNEIASEITREIAITGVWGISIEHVTGKSKCKG